MADAKFLTMFGIPYWAIDSSSTTFRTFTLDENGDKCFWVFQAPEAATITGAGFKYDSRTGTPPTYRISLQGVSATDGSPDGTVLGGGSPASVTFTPPADATWNSTWREQTFTNSYTCTRGQLIALVIEYSSGTINGSNCSVIAHGAPSSNIETSVLPYSGTYNVTGTALSKFEAPAFLVRSASKVYGRPILNTNKDLYSSDSTPDEYACRFVIDSGWCSTYKVAGIRAGIRTGAGSKTMKVQLYDGTTVLQTITIDSDQLGSTVEHGRVIEVLFTDSTLSTLTAGNTYRIGFQPQETSTNFALYSYEANAASDLAAWPGGSNCYLSTRTDAGAWTDATTKRPLFELIMSDITTSATGGIFRRASLEGL